ncbi:MAG: hypothetical protein AB7E80_01050 [Hyphomicrobiaceae bacterium]
MPVGGATGQAQPGPATAAVVVGAGVLLLAAAVVLGLFDGFGASTGDGAEGANNARPKVASQSMIRPVAPQQVEQAIAALMMSEAQKTDVRTAVTQDRARLGWITVSDIRAEDGDWVRIAAGPFVQDVRLLNKPHTIAVPYLPGMPVSVTGLVDGGGGDITVAVYLGSSQISLKPLKKGEALHLPSP